MKIKRRFKPDTWTESHITNAKEALGLARGFLRDARNAERTSADYITRVERHAKAVQTASIHLSTAKRELAVVTDYVLSRRR